MPDFIYHKGARHTIGGDRDEEPRAACADNFWAFDEMLEHRPGSKHWRYARDVAAHVCKPCKRRPWCDAIVEPGAEGDAA